MREEHDGGTKYLNIRQELLEKKKGFYSGVDVNGELDPGWRYMRQH